MRVLRQNSAWFIVKLGQHRDCDIFMWLCDVFMNRVLREVLRNCLIMWDARYI